MLFGSKISKNDANRLLSSWGLHIVSNLARMLGDFCREGAVLLIVFVPLELLRPGAGAPDKTLVWRIAVEGTGGLLVIGVILEFFALLTARFARDLEKTNDSSVA